MNNRERFDKYTERARKVLSLAQEEAQRFNHNYIGTEHLLLGLVREGDGVAAKVLSNLGVELNKVRSAVEAIIGRGDRIVLGEIGLTPRSKKVLELAVDEARRLNHHYIGTEHLLLGMVREGEGIAAGVLESLGVSLDKVRIQTIQVLNQGHAGRAATFSATAMELGMSPTPTGVVGNGPKSNVITCRIDDQDMDALDALVEAGIRSTRSDAAAWLIHAGIETQGDLFKRVNATVEQIRRLRAEAQRMAQEATGKAASPPKETPPGDTEVPPEQPEEN